MHPLTNTPWKLVAELLSDPGLQLLILEDFNNYRYKNSRVHHENLEDWPSHAYLVEEYIIRYPKIKKEVESRHDKYSNFFDPEYILPGFVEDLFLLVTYLHGMKDGLKNGAQYCASHNFKNLKKVARNMGLTLIKAPDYEVFTTYYAIMRPIND